MIFAIGVVLVILGSLIVSVAGNEPFHDSKADYLGGGLSLLGFVLALGSLLHFTAKVLA